MKEYHIRILMSEAEFNECKHGVESTVKMTIEPPDEIVKQALLNHNPNGFISRLMAHSMTKDLAQENNHVWRLLLKSQEMLHENEKLLDEAHCLIEKIMDEEDPMVA